MEFGAKFATDLDFRTNSISIGAVWLEVILSEVHCIDKVLTFSNDGQPRANWDCSETDCDKCESPNDNKCDEYELILSAPEDPSRVSISNYCKYGNKVKIQKKKTGISHMWTSEIAVIEGEGKISWSRIFPTRNELYNRRTLISSFYGQI